MELLHIQEREQTVKAANIVKTRMDGHTVRVQLATLNHGLKYTKCKL